MKKFTHSIINKKSLIATAIGIVFSGFAQSQPAQENSGAYQQCELEFQVKTQWETGYVGEFILTNLDSKPINNIELSFEGDLTLAKVWNATLKSTQEFKNGKRYSVRSQVWNRHLDVGNSMRVGVEINAKELEKPFHLLVNGQPCSARRTGGFFTSWGIDREAELAYDLDDLPLDDINQLHHAFASIDEQGLAIVGDQYADLKYPYASSGVTGHLNQYAMIKEQYPNMNLTISVAEQDHAGINFSLAASSPAHRQAFAQSVIAFIDNYGFNSVDIDWEFPSSEQDQVGFNLLLKELRYQLDEKGLENGEYYTLSADLPIADYQMEFIDLSEFHQHLDQVNVMSYQYHGSWMPFTFHNAPLFPNYEVGMTPQWAKQLTIQWSVEQYVNAGVPKHKLNLGLPLFAASWTNVPNVNNGLAQYSTDIVAEEGTTYRAAVNLYKNEGYYLGWDEISKNSYLYHPTKKNGHFIQFDDARTVNAKLDWAKEQGLGGAFIWELSFDSPTEYTIIPVIADNLKNQ